MASLLLTPAAAVPMPSRSSLAAVILVAASLAACRPADSGATMADAQTAEDADTAAGTAAGTTARETGAAQAASGTASGRWVIDSASAAREPNEMGRVPILEYHLISERQSMWAVPEQNFRRHLQLLYDRGYRPITVADLIDKKIDLPRGLSPIVFTFDDASPSQFRYIERADGTLDIDPTSAVGIWMEFKRRNPDWDTKATFCMLSAASEGHAFFGERNIQDQKTAWRHQKVRFLHEQGFELCNHTLYHANLGRSTDAAVQEQIARGVMAIDSAVPGYNVRTFALPLGVWPQNRELAFRGSWTDPKSGRAVRYQNEAVLEVSGGPARSPHDPRFNPKSLPRFIVHGNELEKLLDQLDRNRTRYVSDGDPGRVTAPRDTAAVARQ